MSNKNVETNYILLQPNFYLSYKVTKTSSLNLNGSRFTNTPSIAQLQPLTDNSNPLFITTGNPFLKPSANNYFSVSYNRFNPTSGTSINISANFSNTDNQIMNNSIFDTKTGIQTTFYDNINGNYNYGGRISGGFKIKRLFLTINPNAGVSSSHNNSFLNKNIVSSNSINYSLGLGLNYAPSADLQFFNRTSGSIRKVKYDYNNLASNSFRSVYNNLTLNAALPYNLRFILASNLNYNANIGIGANNNVIHTANVSMEKMFLKKSLSLKASVSDVFNNSRNSSRYASDTYILESIDLNMRRYFLLGLTYRIKKFGSASPSSSPPPSVIRF